MKKFTDLYTRMHLVIMMAEEVDQEVRDNNLQNSQEFLNWQDELNKISVKGGE